MPELAVFVHGIAKNASMQSGHPDLEKNIMKEFPPIVRWVSDH